MTTSQAAATALLPADVHAVAARLRAGVTPLRVALDVAAAAETRAAAGASALAGAALRQHVTRLRRAVEDHLASLAALTAALDTATGELVAQDAVMVRL